MFSITAVSVNYSRDMFYSFSTFVKGVVGQRDAGVDCKNILFYKGLCYVTAGCTCRSNTSLTCTSYTSNHTIKLLYHMAHSTCTAQNSFHDNF